MAKAAHVLAALKRDGWMETRRSGSHRVLAKGDQQRVWAYHDGVDLGGPAMARIARDYGYTAAVLAGQKEFRRTTPESSGPVLADAGFPGDRLEHPGGRGMRPGGACLAGWRIRGCDLATAGLAASLSCACRARCSRSASAAASDFQALRRFRPAWQYLAHGPDQRAGSVSPPRAGLACDPNRHRCVASVALDDCPRLRDRAGTKDDPVHQPPGLLAVHLRLRHGRKLAHQ